MAAQLATTAQLGSTRKQVVRACAQSVHVRKVTLVPQIKLVKFWQVLASAKFAQLGITHRQATPDALLVLLVAFSI